MQLEKLKKVWQSLRQRAALRTLPEATKRLGADACLAALSLTIAYFLRFLPVQFVFDAENQAAREECFFYLRQLLLIFPLFTLVRLVLFHLFGLYRGISRFAGIHELRQVIFAVTSGTALLVVWDFLATWV